MKRYWLKITTSKGTFIFPFEGFKTLREAESQADLARNEPQNWEVKVIKGY